MSIKRWLAADGSGLWTPYVEVVLASDYDAIDADLNECIKDRDDAYARVDAMQAGMERQRIWLISLRDRMGKSAEPWLGVRADIIPPSVQSIVVWYNEISAMLQQPDADGEKP